MAPVAVAQYNPSGGNSPFMTLPEHVDGIIDLRTLADIHKFLSQSEIGDDLQLAKWVKEEYLFEPLGDEGRQIRTTEGFARLDRAYRRVRHLTGKAQDKWPFFDRNWKTMPSAVVRNLSLGESPPGTSLPDTNGKEGLVNHQYETTQPMKLQVPFGKKQPPRRRISKLALARPAKGPLASLLTDEQIQHETTSQARAQPSNGDVAQPGTTTPQKYPDTTDHNVHDLLIYNDNSTIDEDMRMLPSPADTATTDHLRDAGGGKVRGVNGRFHPKSKDSPASQAPHYLTDIPMPVGEADLHRPERLVNTLDSTTNQKDSTSDLDKEPTSKSEVINGTNDISMSEPENVLSSAVDQSGDKHDRAASQPASIAYAGDSILNEIMPFSILAAEAEAIPSNLDRLPPNLFRKNKRKTDSVAQRGQNKRTRGSRGGLVGRPRKSEYPVIASGQETSGTAEEATASEDRLEKTSPSPQQMSNRRTTRRSTAVAPPDTPLSEDLVYVGVSEQNEQTLNHGEDKTSLSVERDMNIGLKAPVDVPATSTAIQPVVKKTPGRPRKKAGMEPCAFSTTPAKANPKSSVTTSEHQKPTPATQRPKSKQCTVKGTKPRSVASAKSSKLLNGASKILAHGDDQAPEPGTVEFLARIHSRAGISEIPLPDYYLSADAEIIRRYAKWKEEEVDTCVSFEVFKKISAFVAAPTPNTK